MGILSIFSMFFISVSGIESKTASSPIRAKEMTSLFQTTRRVCHRLGANRIGSQAVGWCRRERDGRCAAKEIAKLK
jgi:hypothetical protein